MTNNESSALRGILRDPWSIVPRQTFDGVFVGLIGACQLVLQLYFLRNRPEIAFIIGSSGLLLLWFAGNIAFDNDPLASFWGRDGIQSWLHLVLWSTISIAVVVATAVTVLGI